MYGFRRRGTERRVIVLQKPTVRRKVHGCFEAQSGQDVGAVAILYIMSL